MCWTIRTTVTIQKLSFYCSDGVPFLYTRARATAQAEVISKVNGSTLHHATAPVIPDVLGIIMYHAPPVMLLA